MIPTLITFATLGGLALARNAGPSCDGLSAEDATMARRVLRGSDASLKSDLRLSDLQLTGLIFKLAAKAEAAGCSDLATKLQARGMQVGD